MTFLGRGWKSNKMSFARAATLSGDDAQALQEQAEAFDSPIYTLQPYHGENGVEEAVNLLGGLYHHKSRLGFINNSESHVFEMWFNGERTTYHYIPEEIRTGESFREQMSEDYPHTNVTQSFDTYPQLNKDDEDDESDDKPGMFDAGRAIAGARFDLIRNPIYPIRSLEHGGFGTRNRGSTRDPYKDIIGPFTRDEECQLIFQLVFYPTKRGRFTRWSAGRKAENLRGKQPYLLDERDPTKQEKEAAKVIEEQKTRDIFSVGMRLLVSAPTKSRAKDRLSDLTNQINNRYQTNLNQRFYAAPASSYWPGGWNNQYATQFASSVINRNTDDRSRIECTPEELAGLAHLPSDDVQNQHVDWTATKAGEPVPIGTPRFSWGAHDLDPMDLTPHQEQEAMLTRPDKDHAYWLGRGARKATEAGIDEELLKLHMFVGGTTGYGKTTTLKNLFYQIMQRGHGGMFYDPKADDAKDFVSLVPEGREDDLIYVEVGGDREQQVGFNFLEIPGDPDPDSPRFAEAVESLADDIEALLAQAGGSDEYWGPRMSRVVRNMARGMAKSGRKLTLLDMYYALIDEEGRQRYAQHLSDERIEWIVDYAARQLADMDDSDIEPLIGRLQQWVESDLMRSIVSHPESTFSVEEAVAEGKIIVVRDCTDTSGTAGTMIATALIRRIWAAVQKREEDERFEEPPMFYAILDEFDKIASEQAATAEILSLARAFNLSMIPACQDLTAQLKDQEDIQDAILGQCNTFINFNPRREGEGRKMTTRHEGVDVDDITNLPRYQFYMRTEDDNGDQTYSYKVNAFPPVDEVIEDAARSEDETEALIQRSLEKHAAERMTSEEIRQSSEFRGDPGGMDADEMADVANAGKDEDTRERDELFAAVDRAQIRSERIGDFVPAEEVATAWATISESGEKYKSQVANIVEKTSSELLEERQEGGSVSLRLTTAGREAAGLIQDTGSGGSGGKYIHRWVLSQSKLAYERMGYMVSLPSQDAEGELPDGVGKLPIDPTKGKDLNEIHELEDRLKNEYPAVYEYSGKDGKHLTIEAETTTFEKPMQTLTNLRKAIQSNTFCAFTTKDGSYDPANYDDQDDVPGHESLFEYWARRGQRIMYATNECEDLIFARERDDAGNRWFYNQSHLFRIEESPAELVALRPADDETAETIWRDDGEEIVLASRHKNGPDTVHARFAGGDDLADPPREAFPAYYEHNPEGDGEYHVQEGGDKSIYQTKDEMLADWTPVKAPFVPEIEFVDEDGSQRMPTEDDFDFVVFPNDTNDEYDEPMRYNRGELSPLLPEDMNMPSAVVEQDPDLDEPTDEAAGEDVEADEPTESPAEDVSDERDEPAVAKEGEPADAPDAGEEQEPAPQDVTAEAEAGESTPAGESAENAAAPDSSDANEAIESPDSSEEHEDTEPAQDGKPVEEGETPQSGGDSRSQTEIAAEAEAVASAEPGDETDEGPASEGAGESPGTTEAESEEGATSSPASDTAPESSGAIEAEEAGEGEEAPASTEGEGVEEDVEVEESGASPESPESVSGADSSGPAASEDETTPVDEQAAAEGESSDEQAAPTGGDVEADGEVASSDDQEESDDDPEADQRGSRSRRRRAKRMTSPDDSSEENESEADD